MIAASDVVCLASGGPRPAPSLIQHAFSARAIPVAARIDAYAELVGEEETGLMFPPGDVITLSGQLQRLLTQDQLRSRLARASAARARSWSDVADDLEVIYERLCSLRHDPEGSPTIRRRIEGRPTIDCDLHMLSLIHI